MLARGWFFFFFGGGEHWPERPTKKCRSCRTGREELGDHDEPQHRPAPDAPIRTQQSRKCANQTDEQTTRAALRS